MATFEDKKFDGCTNDLSNKSILTNDTSEIIVQDENLGIPLESSWTFWLDKVVPGITVTEYKDNLKEIYTFNTIQSFWAIFNNIPKACDVQNKYSYHLMRDGRLPLWEEEVNQKGGTWRFKCHKSDTDKVWKEIVLGAIGEQFNDFVAKGDEICGVSVSIRDRDDLIQIWNVNKELAPSANILRKVHELISDVTLLAEFYKPHQSHHAYNRR